MHSPQPLKTLFLCTGNSARSLLGEYLLRHLAGHRFATASAGSDPTGIVHPLTLQVLREDFGIDAGDAQSKSVASLVDQSFDLVFTVCDHAREHCPIFPEATTLIHWGMPDPAAVTGPREARRQAFLSTALALEGALKALASQPVESMDPAARRLRLQTLAPFHTPEEAV